MFRALMSFGNMMGNIKTTCDDISNISNIHTTSSTYYATQRQQVEPQKPQTSNVKKRTLIYNALFKPKPDDFGNALYNYGCFVDSDEIIQNINCFSVCEKHYVVQKLDENGKLRAKNDWLMQNGWGETKTDIEESSGYEPNTTLRNKLLDPLYFSKDELANLEKELERFKVYLQGCNNRHKDTWFRQRAPIFQNLLKIFDEFSHVELIVLYEHLKEKDEAFLQEHLNNPLNAIDV